MKKIAILIDKENELKDVLDYELKDFNIKFFENIPDEDFDIVVILKDGINYDENAIKCTFSLLPAFADSNNPIKEALEYGSKVTGLTVYYTQPFKVIEQYPIHIDADKHYDDIEKELKYLRQIILPYIIKQLALNEQINLKTLFKKSCTGGCSGCGGCR